VSAYRILAPATDALALPIAPAITIDRAALARPIGAAAIAISPTVVAIISAAIGVAAIAVIAAAVGIAAITVVAASTVVTTLPAAAPILAGKRRSTCDCVDRGNGTDG
jgi:hypothetical protein